MPAGVGHIQSNTKGESLFARAVHFDFIWLWFDSDLINFELFRLIWKRSNDQKFGVNKICFYRK